MNTIISIVAILAIAVLAADASEVKYGQMTKGVFWVHKGRYTFSREQASAACEALGTTLASKEQLEEARKAGMDQCNCGWTSSSSTHAYYPINNPRRGCGSHSASVRTCGWRSSYDAYCYSDKDSYTKSSGSARNGVFHLKKGRYTLTLDGAKIACKRVGATLASYDQLDAAWKRGMNQCNCGWTTDGKSHYPIVTSLRSGCGGSNPGIRTCGWSNKWDAYCYKTPEFQTGLPKKGVFWLHKGRYSLTHSAAKKACKSVGAKLATHDQLKKAWEAGMDQCNCGWLSGITNKAYYPINTSLRSGCGGTHKGIRQCGWRSTWDAYCYRK